MDARGIRPAPYRSPAGRGLSQDAQAPRRERASKQGAGWRRELRRWREAGSGLGGCVVLGLGADLVAAVGAGGERGSPAQLGDFPVQGDPAEVQQAQR